MAKAVALLFIVMIGAATTMPALVMGCASYDCPPPGRTPSVPNGGSSPAGGGSGGGTPRVPGGGSSPAGGGSGGGSSPAGGGSGGGSSSCPLDALKLGVCVDLLGGLVHVGIGDPIVNQCCPVLAGVLELEAALCFCTTIRIKLLNLNVILPLALELFVQCGLTPPPGFTCPPLN